MNKEVSDFLQTMDETDRTFGFKVPYAFNQDGEVITPINAVKKKSYNCNCGEEVRLRGGRHVKNHFYHVSYSECNGESWLHKECKRILLKNKRIYRPSIKSYLDFDEILIEKKRSDFIIDAIGVKDGQEYWIEFMVTHSCSQEKINFVLLNKIDCFEIQLPKGLESESDITRAMYSEENICSLYDRHKTHYDYNKLLEDNESLNFQIEEYKKELMDLQSTSRILEIIHRKLDRIDNRVYNAVTEKDNSGLSIFDLNKKSMWLKKKENGDHFFCDKKTGIHLYPDNNVKNKYNFRIYQNTPI